MTHEERLAFEELRNLIRDMATAQQTRDDLERLAQEVDDLSARVSNLSVQLHRLEIIVSAPPRMCDQCPLKDCQV